MIFVDQVIIVILAAGASTRMGRIKQLLPVNGVALLQKAVDAATSPLFSTNCQSIVVLGANAGAIENAIDFKGCQILINNQWQSGMSSSIVCALSFIERNFSQVAGVILMLGDQPHVTDLILASIMEKQHLTDLPIVASAFTARPSGERISGPPAYFSREIFPELLQLKGDAGARKVIQAQSNRVATIDFSLGAIDIDCQSDYASFEKGP